MKVALIGIGGMGGCHYYNYKSIPEAELIAVADVRTDMAKEKVKGTDTKVYATMDELLANEKPEMIDICTPSYLHADMAIKALEAGCHVLCEKPMTLSTADAQRVLEAAKKSDKLFMVAHVVRFMAPYMYLRNVIKSGELGKLLRLDMKRISAIPTWSWEDWMRQPEKSGGTPMDLMIHDLDYIQSVLGMPDSISGIYHALREDNDFAVANLMYGDTIVSTEATWFHTGIPFDASFLAVFENGFIKLAGGQLYRNGEKIEVDQGTAANEDLGINVGNSDGYGSEIRYFMNCIKENKAPEMVTPKSSFNSVKVVEDYRAAAVEC